MARRSLQLRSKKPLPKGRIRLNMTNRDKAKWDGPCLFPDPWDDLWIWNDDCIWLDDGAELVTDGGVPVLDGGEIVLDGAA
jgi:hypothetical protein